MCCRRSCTTALARPRKVAPAGRKLGLVHWIFISCIIWSMTQASLPPSCQILLWRTAIFLVFLVLHLGYEVVCELVTQAFGNLDNLSRWRQVDSNPAPHACAPCAGMMSYPNSRRPMTVWYESSVISILTPSPSTGHISALRCRLLEILGALQSSQWVLFSNWIYSHLFVLVRSRAQVFLPSLRSSHS